MKKISFNTSEGVIPGLVKAVKEIIDVLPSLEITGSKNISVNRSGTGTTLTVKDVPSIQTPQISKSEDPFELVSNYCHIVTLNNIPYVQVNYGTWYIAGREFSFQTTYFVVPAYNPDYSGLFYITREIVFNPATKQFTWNTWLRRDEEPAPTDPMREEFKVGIIWVSSTEYSVGSLWTAGDIISNNRLGVAY